MKILVRKFENDGTCTYVWKKIRSVNPFVYGSYHTEDGKVYVATEILKITHDYRKLGYVQCDNCGTVIKKNKVEQHYLEQERNANCMKCSWLKVDGGSKPIYTMRSDGTVCQKIIGVPLCSKGRYYGQKRLTEVNKVEECKYYACRRSRIRELHSDFLSENPNPYNELLTENAVIAAGWKYMDSMPRGRMYSWDEKLIAHFDKNGLLVGFNFIHRSTTYVFTYSDVYDKTISPNGEFTWDGIANKTRDKYMKQIRKLYR